MCAVNTDTLYPRNKSPDNCIQTADKEKKKKKKYLESCLHKC